MKRFFALILSIVYFTLSTDAAVNIHFCSGEIESIHINATSQICCCGSGEMSKDCCKDENLVLELDTDQTFLSIQNVVPEQFEIINYLFYTNSLIIEETINTELANYSIPPPKLQPTWLLNCTFTFYG